jgi:hypothetical protein
MDAVTVVFVVLFFGSIGAIIISRIWEGHGNEYRPSSWTCTRCGWEHSSLDRDAIFCSNCLKHRRLPYTFDPTKLAEIDNPTYLPQQQPVMQYIPVNFPDVIGVPRLPEKEQPPPVYDKCVEIETSWNPLTHKHDVRIVQSPTEEELIRSIVVGVYQNVIKALEQPQTFTYVGLTIPIHEDIRGTNLWYRYKAVLLGERGHYCQKHGDRIPCAGYFFLHHIVEVRHGGTNLPENLILVCNAHHDLLHPHLWNARFSNPYHVN